MPHATSSAPLEPDWAAFVGLDWGDEKHYWKLRDAHSQQSQEGVLQNTPEALDAWAAELNVRFGGRPIAVCLEQSRGAVVYQLSKYPHLILYPVHPTTSARFREAFYPSGAKSDPQDGDVLLDLVEHHRDRLRRLDPDTPETRLLQMLVEQRRAWVDEKTRHSNRLTGWLKIYFPQVLDWIDDIDSPLGCDLLDRWPTLEELQKSHPGTLHTFFVQHNCRSEKRMQERIQAIYQATPAIRDTAMLEAGPAIVKQIVAVIRTLRANIDVLDKRIASLVSTHPERALFEALPGVGPALLPRLIVAFGTKRERYTCADQLEAYSGIAPVTQQSGKSKWVHFRWACPKFLRQTLHEFAAHSIAKSVWARAFYDMQIAKGKGHHAAVRSLAFKWIRVLFACWKNHTPYDEQTYLRALQNNGSRLSQILATQLTWKTVGGFQKLCSENA
jgi:transposase